MSHRAAGAEANGYDNDELWEVCILTYFGTRLSENISRREPEGYLICLNVPVARTGVQEYLPSELGLPEPDSRLIPVSRPESEVFAPACVASFEGMPVTDDHPSAPEGVTAENSRLLQKGHAHHVRRGAGEDADLLLADLIITDPVLIDEVLAGKREISCGYTYTLCEEDGQYLQREIRGNHIAVVDAGRAGPRVSIQDQEPASRTSGPAPVPPPDQTHSERSTPMKKKSLWRAKMMARMAKDGDVEGLAEIITEMMEEPVQLAEAAAVPADPPALPADPVVAAVVSAVEENLAPQEAPVVVETPVDQPVIVDCGPRILEALERIIALLSGTADCNPVQPDCGTSCDPDSAAKDENPDAVIEAVAETAAEELAGQVAAAAVEAVAEAAAPEISENLEPEDPVEALVAEILESGEEEETPEEEILSGILEPEGDAEEETPEENAQAADALRATLATFRPMLQKMSPQDRRRFNADVAARMKKLTRKAPAGKPSAYAALRKSAGNDTAARDLGRRIMESRNVNISQRQPR